MTTTPNGGNPLPDDVIDASFRVIPDDGGPAFPQHGWSSNPEVVRQMQDKQGMSLRDYFAGQALAHPATHANTAFQTPPKEAAQWAYEIADAMLAARKVGGA